MNKFLLTFLFSLFIFCSCKEKITNKFDTDNLELSYKTEYAEGFEIFAFGESSIIKIKDLWNNGEDIFYFLSRNNEEAPVDFPGITINIPVSNVVCMSSTYIAFLETLGYVDIIKGISGGDFISSPDIRQRIKNNDVKDVGYENNINYEILVEISPDIVMTYGISGESSLLGPKTEELGLDTFYIGEYLEITPLGKAEWIMIFAELIEQKDAAREIFENIKNEYIKYSDLIKEDMHKPTVMLNSPWRDTWFVPGDKNYMVRLIDDAGGDYVYKGHDSSQSRPISIEDAYVYAVDADFWLNPGSAATIQELIEDNPKFSNIKSVLSGQVYNNTKRSTPEGGSDFWEAGAVMPDVILKDIIDILHPGLIPEHELYFFSKLE
ncbi:MAG: ABC transporter substrate-binding protein [Rikenellaceae bacterium]|nr:ABC transporter substrate-binding protein [Rikenellaceae bacterium]